MRVLQIGSDRSKRGILVPHAPGYLRQKAYAEKFGALDIIGYSLSSDGFAHHSSATLNTYPTNSPTKLLYGTNALAIARTLPKPDVVSAQDPHQSGLLALWIARARGVPLHIQVHSDIFAPAFVRHSLGNRIRARIARFVLKRADGIRVVSDRIKVSIEKRLTPKNPIAVLPIFTDLEKIRTSVPDQTLTERFSRYRTKVLFVGRLESEKRPLRALEAFVKSAPEDACLILVGTGSMRAELEASANASTAHERIFFEGEHDAAPYYKLADLILVTSEYEGYGLVIVEGLAAGKPVLSTDVGIAPSAGAILSTGDFAGDLALWFESGPRTGVLKSYPYRHFDEYVEAYCDDIMRCAVLK